jgi:hypothetical protein
MATKTLNTTDMEIGQVPDIILSNGTINRGAAIEAVGEKLNTDYLDALAFMEDPMEIMVMETSDDNAENPVLVGNGGQFMAFYRGIPTLTRRKFVDSLIVKTSRVTTPKIRNGAGEDAFAIRQNSAHKFPFSVISDKNPKGAEWLRGRLAEQI